MEDIFEFENQEYTLLEVEEAAKKKSLSIDDYIKKYNISRKPGKTNLTSPGADVKDIAAPELTVTDSPSVNISLDLSETPKTGTQAGTEFIPEAISKERENEILLEYDEISNIDIEQEAINKKQSKLKRFQQGEFKLEEKEEFNYWKNSNGKLFEESETLSEKEIEDRKQANQTVFLSKIPAYERQQIFAKNKKVLEEQTNFVNKSIEKRDNLISQYNDIANTDIKSSEDFIYRKNLINQIKFEDIERRRALSNLNRTEDLVDDFKRSYSFYDTAEQSFKTIGTDLAIGVMSTIDMLKTEEGQKISYSNDLIDFREGLQQFAEENLAKPISIENVNSLDKAFVWGTQALANQLPTLAMAFTGQAAIPLFFATGYGSKMSDFELGERKAKKELPLLDAALKLEKDPERRKEIQKNIDYYSRYLNVSDAIKVITSAAHGGAEAIFEGLTTLKLVRDLQNIGTNILKAGGSRKAVYNAFRAAPMSIGLESLGETATQISQNAADILIFKDDKSLLENVSEAAAQGALFGSGFAVPNLGAAINAGIQSTISTKNDNAKIKKTLKEINDLTFELESNNKLTSENKKELQKNIQQKISELVTTTDITRARFQRLSYEQQQEVFDLERQVNNSIKRWTNIGASNMSESTKNSLREEIKNEIQALQDKKQALLESGDSRLKELTTISTKNLLSDGDILQKNQQYSRWKQGVQTFIKKYNLPIEVSVEEMSKEEIQKYLESNDAPPGGKYANGKITLYENVASQINPSTPVHELTHAILEQFGLTKKDFDKLENSFKSFLELKKANGEITDKQYKDTIEKYEKYQNDPSQKKFASEELWTSFIDAISEKVLDKKDVSFLLKIGQSLKNIISSKSSKIEAENFKLNTPEDVYDFLTQFAESVAQKKDFKRIVGVEIPEKIKEDVEKFSKSMASEKVQEIYEAQGAANAMDIIDEFKPITNKIVNRYRDVPGFEFELLRDEIETGKRGILDMIMDYTPEKAKGAPLAAYINSLLPKRAIEAANRILDTEFKLDVTEAKGVTDTVTAEETIEREEAAPADEIKSLRKQIGLSEELVTKVKDAVVKTFGTKLPNPQDPKFRFELQKRFRTELKKPLSKFVGKQADYEAFLRDNFESVYSKMPQSLINRRFKEFAEPVLDKNGKQVREKTAEGNKVYVKKKISKAEWIKYFIGADVKSSTKGARKTAIVEGMAEEIAFDATMEVLDNPDVISKYQDIAGITGEVLPENFKSLIAKQVDRAEDFKFSKSLINDAKTEYNLESQELAKILDKTSLDKLSNKYSLISDNIIYEADPANIKFSLTTKADGKWEQNQLNPLEESAKIYKFKVGEIDYEINAFKDPSGYNYDIFEQTEGIEDGAINNDPKSWELAFASATTKRVGLTEYALKGRTNQFKVFGTVANATIDLIKKEKLNSITFTAKEESRKRLYNSLNKKFANELGWETYDYPADIPDGSETIFIAYDPKAFNTEPQITTPPQIKFSLNTNNEFNVTAKELLYNSKAWAEYSNNILNRSQFYQNYIGSIEASLGSVRPSNVIDYAGIVGYKKLTDKEQKIFKEKIKQLQQKIIAQKTANTDNMLQDGPAYKSPPYAFGKTVSEFKKKLKNGEIFKHTKQYQRIYRDMWSKYFDMLAADNTMYNFLELTLNNSNTDTSHWHRQGALFIGFDQGALPTPLLDKNGKQIFRFTKEGKKYPLTRVVEFEHAVQNHIQWRRVLKATAKFAKKNDKKGFIKYLEKSMEDYVLIGMAYADARKVDKAGYAHIMPEGWKRWWDRYFNNKVAKIDGGINANNISFIEYTNTKANIKGNIAREFNISNSNGNIKLSKSLSKEFNNLLQQTTGVPFYEKFSPVKATMMGRGKGKKFFIPYSADDFVGLLYATLGTKKQGGNEQMKWYEENLLRPFSRGIQQYETAKQVALRNWQALKKEAKKDVPGGLNKVNETGFTNQNSLRIYMWRKQGIKDKDIPGISSQELRDNSRIVRNDPKLKAFAERLMALNPEGYPPPSTEWIAGDITTDLVSYINDVKRAEYLTQWKENVDQIFNDQNKNKLKALYGDSYIKALENMLYRMEKGRNKFKDASDIERRFQSWVNNSVGSIMFFNARSAVLQTLSAVNFINFSDNNPIAAGIALANFPQYVKDFSTLFNSDFLKQRRSGLQTDVNADEIAKAAATSKNQAQAMLAAILKFGFTPTQIADSFAIASGGATFYRNRINKYKKEGLSQKEAEQKAFTDFQEIAEETQQSARPDRISMQQAGSLGRLVLAFGNTPMQYARLTKKATLDLINGRGDWKTNISKIAYYSVIQNIIFSALQQGLFALLFDDEEEDDKKARYYRIGNSSADTLLRGMGVYGAAAATVKNMIIKIVEETKKSRPDYTKVAIEATAISPPINSKLRKLVSAGKTFTYKQSREKVFTEGFSLDNPALLAVGKVISAGTNLPADRIVLKMDHIYTAMQPETELWQGTALTLGWGEWELGMIEKQTKKESNLKIKPFKKKSLKIKKFKN